MARFDALGDIGRGLALGEHIAQRPQRDAMAQLGLQKQQQALAGQQAQAGRQQAQFDQGESIERSRITNQLMRALKNIKPAQGQTIEQTRATAFQSMIPKLQEFNIDTDAILQKAKFTDQELDNGIIKTQAFLDDPGRSNKFGRVFEAQGEGGKGFYQASDSGDIRQLPGISPTARAAKTVNIGGVLHALNQDTGAVTRLTVDGIPVTPETVGSSEREIAKQTKIGESIGKRTGSAITDLPQILATANDSLATIDNVLKHPGLAGATGLSGVINPANFVPGTEEHDFALASEQLSGQAFLQAFESLKGGGQITEPEGRKATAAIAQLSKKQSTPQYRTAVRTLRDIIVRAKDRAEDAAFEGQSGANAAIGEQEADDFINSIIGQ